jgi:hypothetical protein
LPVSLARIGREGTTRGRLQRNESRLPEFRALHHEDSSLEVDIARRQRKRFSDSYTGDRQESEDGRQRRRPQRVSRWHAPGGIHQPTDLFLRVQVGCATSATSRNEISGWYFGPRIPNAPVTSEPSNDSDLQGTPTRRDAGLVVRPTCDALDRDLIRLLALEERDKPVQDTVVCGQPESEGATKREVVVDRSS